MALRSSASWSATQRNRRDGPGSERRARTREREQPPAGLGSCKRSQRRNSQSQRRRRHADRAAGAGRERRLWCLTGGVRAGQEWVPAIYDAIVTATSAGIVVVEAAGNGRENLDGAAYGATFPAGRPDSGAIIVGAGGAPGCDQYVEPERSRLPSRRSGRASISTAGASVSRPPVTGTSSTAVRRTAGTAPGSPAPPARHRSSLRRRPHSRARTKPRTQGSTWRRRTSVTFFSKRGAPEPHHAGGAHRTDRTLPEPRERPRLRSGNTHNPPDPSRRG